MKYLEIEFKYKADNILLTKFQEFCSGNKYLNYLHISGYDHFYSHPTDDTQFLRHRIGEDLNQLTFKKKRSADNVVRNEDNVSLAKDMSVERVANFCNSLGYNYDITLYKNCFIYNYEYYTLVYYICYNEGLREIGRFIEIEMQEDYPFSNEKEALSELVLVEKLCKSLGLESSGRVLPSLYELYRRNHVEN